MSQRLVAFEYRGSGLGTRAAGMAYVVRLVGHEEAWRTVYARRVEYRDLPVGEYVFEVRAVDRDLLYSEPARLCLSVVPDPRVEALSQAASGGGAEFVGSSPSLRRVQEQLTLAAPTEVTVLILGETGTGKGLAARAVHARSPRRHGPFIQVNCGAIPSGLVESELFGHEKGAFTGAIARKVGKAELAQGGTLFLDEIGDLSPEAQAKLLRLLEERQFERVGGTYTLRADARVIAATNRDLRRMVEQGTFREDLYYRLQVFPVRLPPLRERREDIPTLAAYFVARMAAHLGKPVRALSEEVVAALEAHDWPGNVRELEHAMQRAVIVCAGTAIETGDVLLERGAAAPASPVRLTPQDYERAYLRDALERARWVVRGPRGAAAFLGMAESTLRDRMRRLDLRKP